MKADEDFVEDNISNSVIKMAIHNKLVSDLENEERDARIRLNFRAYMDFIGCNAMMRAHPDPLPGAHWGSRHVQQLWECYLHATLLESGRKKAIESH